MTQNRGWALVIQRLQNVKKRTQAEAADEAFNIMKECYEGIKQTPASSMCAKQCSNIYLSHHLRRRGLFITTAAAKHASCNRISLSIIIKTHTASRITETD